MRGRGPGGGGGAGEKHFSTRRRVGILVSWLAVHYFYVVRTTSNFFSIMHIVHFQRNP